MTSPMLESDAVVRLDIKSEGQAVPETLQIMRVRVQRGLRTIGRCTLTFIDDAFTVVASGMFNIGKTVSVAAGYGDKTDPAFEGKVTSVTSELDSNGGLSLTVVVQDGAYELLRNTDVESFTDMSLKAIVTSLVQTAGLSLGTIDLPTTPVKYALRNDTALGMIDEIAQRTRARLVHPRQHVLDVVRGHRQRPGRPARLDHDRAWTSCRSRPGRSATAPPRSPCAAGTPSRSPRWSARRPRRRPARASTRPPAAAPRTRGSTPGRRPRSQTDATLAAQAIAARTGRVTATGECQYTALLVPGGRLIVNGAGPVERATTTSARSTTRGWTATRSRGSSSATATRCSSRTRGRRTSPVSSFRRSGLAVGIVDNVKDPESLGRVRVSLSTASDQLSSAWARVLAMGAGANRGQVVIPEVGDEVLLGFEDDDITRPVVLGGLYGNKSTTPTAEAVDQNGAVVTRALTSRLGHTLTMSDGTTPATQHVQLALAGLDHSLRIGKDRADLKVPAGVPLKIAVGTAFIEFDGNGGITIDATKITIKATAKVAISGADVEATATAGLKLQGTQATLKGTGMGTVEAGGVLEVKGAMVKIN